MQAPLRARTPGKMAGKSEVRRAVVSESMAIRRFRSRWFGVLRYSFSRGAGEARVSKGCPSFLGVPKKMRTRGRVSAPRVYIERATIRENQTLEVR